MKFGYALLDNPWQTDGQRFIEQLIVHTARKLTEGDARPKIDWNGLTIWTDHPGTVFLGDELSLEDLRMHLLSVGQELSKEGVEQIDVAIAGVEQADETDLFALRRIVALQMQKDREYDEIHLESETKCLRFSTARIEAALHPNYSR